VANIKITDQFGLDIDAQLADGTALRRYFQQIPSLKFDSLDLRKVQGMTVDDPAATTLSLGASFAQPVSLGASAPELSVGAGAQASIRLLKDLSEVPGQDDGEPLQDTVYVAFGIEATVAANIAMTTGSLRFGAEPATRVKLLSYSPFPLKAGVTLVDAVRDTVASFAVPANIDDAGALPAGHIAAVDVIGKLELSASAELLATANPLASASLPSPLPAASVSAGGSATVGVSFEIEAEYEVLARKLRNGAVRLGWYRRQTTEVAVRAQVSEGITAGLGGMDLFSKVIGAISGNAKADLEELAKGGVSASEAANIQAAVKAAVSRKLEIAVATEFTASDTRSATFLYEISPAALTDLSRQAVNAALRGNLSALHAGQLPGVAAVRSIWDHVRTRGVELNVNLLGILNHRSIASLALDGKVMFEPATGALVIADTAAAERIATTQVNFGADTEKLRRVLAESFLITAVYHGTKQSAGAASLHCSHQFFELHNSTSASDIARDLQTGAALGLLSASETALPAGTSDFGRTLFSTSTEYDNDLVTRMFLDFNNAAHPRELYETAGRKAIQVLVQPDDDDALRLKPATDDGLWNQMKDTGQPGFPTLFRGAPAPLIAAIQADYSAIAWWTDAMSGAAKRLAAMRVWQASHPGASPNDMEFQKLRRDLADHLLKVAANTKEEFGEPWGLIAMNQLVGQRAGARILLTGPKIVREKRRDLAVVTGP
jgi:hypothetical protein